MLALATLSTQEKFLAWFSLAAWLPLSLLSSETRFFIPHLALLILLLSTLVAKTRSREGGNGLLKLACALVLVPAFAWVAEDANRAKLEVYLGARSFGDYLAHTTVSYPTPPYAGIAFINNLPPREGPVLFYMESRTFNAAHPIAATSSDQTPLLETWAEQSEDPASLRKRLNDAGIEYIMVNLGEIVRQHREPNLTPAALIVLNSFWNRYTARVFGVQDPRDRWLGVYRVLSEEEAARPHTFDDLFGKYIRSGRRP
jgi:hypothetical protein